MPKLQSFRLVNISADDNTLVYPDVYFSVCGKNTLIDMRNGGGKTLAIQMLFQTILPNSYFVNKHQIANLLNSVKSGTTMHAVSHFSVEGVQYNDLVLGFCAWAAPQLSEYGEEGALGLRYLNYIISGDNLDKDSLGAQTIPLSSQEGQYRKTHTHEDVKKYLRAKIANARHGRAFNIQIFENKKGQYLTELRKYGINREVFELLMEINKDENYVKQFFEEKCKTPRELMMEFIIPQTEKALAAKAYMPGETREDQAFNLAESLFSKAKNLNELKIFQRDRERYDELIDNINTLNTFMESKKDSLDAFFEHLSQYPKQYSLIKFLLYEEDAAKQNLLAKDSGVFNDMNECQKQIYNIEIQLNRLRMQQAQNDYKNMAGTQNLKEVEINEINKKLDWYTAVNEIIDYKLYEAKYKSLEEKLEKLTDVYYNEDEKLGAYANAIDDISQKQLQKYSELKTQWDEELEKTKNNLNECNQKIGELRSDLKTLGNSIAGYKQEKEKWEIESAALGRDLNTFANYSQSLLPQEELAALENLIVEHHKKLEKIQSELEALQQDKLVNETRGELEEQNKQHLIADKNKNNNDISKYKLILREAEAASGVTEDKLSHKATVLEEERTAKCLYENEINKQISQLKDEIDILRHFGFLRKRSAYDAVHQLKGEWQYARFGSDLLLEKDEATRNKMLSRFPWICETVVVADADYKSLVSGHKKVNLSVAKENLVFMPRSAVEHPGQLRFDNLYLLTPDAKYYTKLLDAGQAVAEREKQIKNYESLLIKTKNEIGQLADRIDVIKRFLFQYPPDRVKHYFDEDLRLKNELKSTEDILIKTRHALEKINIAADRLAAEQDAKQSELEDYQAKKELLAQKTELDEQIASHERLLSQKSIERRGLLRCTDELEYELKKKDTDIKRAEQEINNLQENINTYNEYVQRVAKFKKPDCEFAQQGDIKVLLMQFDIIKQKYDVDNEELDSMLKAQKESQNKMNEIKTGHYVGKFDFNILYRDAQESKYKSSQFSILEATRRDLEEDKKRLNETVSKLYAVFLNAAETYQESLARKTAYYETFQDMALPEAERMHGQLLSKKEEIDRQASEIRKALQKTQEKISLLTGESEKYKAFCNAKGQQLGNAAHAAKQIDFDLMYSRYERLEALFVKNIAAINAKIIDFKDFVGKLEINNIQFKKILHEKLEKTGDYKSVSELGQILTRTVENTNKIIENIDVSINNIGKLDEEIAVQIYRMLCSILDESAKIPEYSKFKFESVYKEFIQINLTEDGCRYKEDESLRRIKAYVYELAAKTENEKFQIKDIKEALSIKRLLPYGVDINRLSIRILKMQNEKSRYYNWGHLMASSGQGYVTYVMFTVTMIRYFNNVSQLLQKNKSPIFIFLDNPFASASAFELWEPVRQFLDKSNAQLLCVAHNPPSPAQILFDNTIIIEQFKNREGQVINQIRNQKIESKELINLTLFDNYTIEQTS